MAAPPNQAQVPDQAAQNAVNLPAQPVRAARDHLLAHPNEQAGHIFNAGVIQNEVRMLAAQLQRQPAAAAAANPGQVPKPGSTAMPTFSEGSSDGWFNFRRKFTACCEINGWNDLRSRRQLIMALDGTALTRIQHLTPEPDPAPPGWNLAAFLDQVEGKFVHAGDTVRARVEYRMARQTKEEDVGAWHTRLQQLHHRAWRNVANQDTAEDLIYNYQWGLRINTIKVRVVEANPATYAEALVAAQQAEAAHLIINAGSLVNPNDRSVNNLNPHKDKECYKCKKKGHIQWDCRSGAPAGNGNGSNNSNGGGNNGGQRGGGAGGSRGRGGRGRGGAGRGNGANRTTGQQQKVNAVTGPEEVEEDHFEESEN